MVLNIKTVKAKLRELATVINANEIILFDKSTFLVICETIISKQKDIHRYEKISNIIKKFIIVLQYINLLYIYIYI